MRGVSETTRREQLCAAGRRLWERGLVGAGEGNLSARVRGPRLLVTPSGVNKSALRPEDLLLVDARDGRVIDGRGRPSSELPLHLAAYLARPEADAVAHAHPLAAVAHTLAGRPLRALTPEAAVVLGAEVPVAPFAIPGTDALAASIRDALRTATVALLERHGAIAVGPDPLACADALEVLERTALTSLYANSLGGSAAPLSPAVLEAVREAARRNGLLR